MHEGLRPMLMGIVLLNLVFVHITKSVSMSWLLPLYALTLAGPILARFHDRLVSRIFWNLSVIAIFALLVNHATGSGVTYLLEDGLILAALCQVHLYNNLGRRQNPDLLFFNSFLIAFVTSFFCQDVVYCAVFVAYVLWVIPTLQIYVVSASGKMDRDLVTRVARDSLPRACLVLAVTGLVFVLWPRDFHREGWVSETMYFASSRDQVVGFSEEVRLGRYGETTFSNEEVLRIDVEASGGGNVPIHWRGATFLHYGTRGWFAEKRLQRPYRPNFDPPWVRQGAGTWERPDREASGTLRVRLLDPSENRLFFPLQVSGFRMIPPADPEYVGTVIDGTVAYLAVGPITPRNRSLTYEVELCDPVAEVLHLSAPHMRQLVSLDQRNVPQIAYDMARSLRDRLPPQHTSRDIVESCRHHLAQSYEYMLPGDKGGASGLDEFLRGNAGGHCEYFATALAVLLRIQDIPCRLVTGFLATEWSEDRSTLIARQRDAHAWVEVLDPQTGWYVVDPSPSVGVGSSSETDSLTSLLMATIEDIWATITGFDSDARAEAWQWLWQSPQRLVAWIGNNLWASTCLAFLCALSVTWKRYLARCRIPALVLAYRTCLRRARLKPLPGETPRELLARAHRSDISRPRLAGLTLAVRAHESGRYGS